MRREAARRVRAGQEKLRARLQNAAFGLLLLGTLSESARAGQDLPAGAASCLECHAKAGQADDAIPPLEDLSAHEIAVALAAFRSGLRDGTIMPRIASGFTDTESRAIAAALGRPEREP